MAKIGYVRVSRAVQNKELQEDALNKAGVIKIFSDVSTRAKFDRDGLNACLEYLRPGDSLVVWKLDRLGGNLGELIKIVARLEQLGIEFESLTEKIDTSNPVGKLFFHIVASIAEYERELIRERVIAGVEAARERGRMGGRRMVMSPQDITMAQSLMKDRTMSVAAIAKRLGVSRATLYNYVTPKGELKVVESKSRRGKDGKKK